MPTVPRVKRVSPQGRVQETALPIVRANTDAPIEAFGGGGEKVLAAQEKLTGVVSKVIREGQERADDILLTDARTRASELKNNLFYNEALKENGKNAFGSVERYGEKFDKGLDEIEGEFNNRQKRKFSKIRANEKIELSANLERHTFKQAQEYQRETLDAGIISSRNDMVLNWHNGPERIAEGLGEVELGAIKLAKTEGLSDEATKLFVDSEISTSHRAVIERMSANGQDRLAKQYRDEAGDELIGEDAEQVDRVLNIGSTLGEAKRSSDAVIGQFPDDQSSAMKELRETVSDAAVYEKARMMTNNYFSDQERVDRQVREDRYREASFIVETTHELPPATMIANLTPTQNNNLERRIGQLTEGVRPTTEWGLYYDLKNEGILVQTRQEFMNRDLMEFQSRLAETEFKELLNFQGDLRKNDYDNIDGYVSAYDPNYKKINSILDEAGIAYRGKYGQPGAKHYDSIAEFRRVIDEKISTEKKRTKKDFLSDDEIQDIVDKTFIRAHKKEEAWWGGTTSYLDFGNNEGREFGFFFIEDVPEEDVREITEELSRRNLPVSDKIIVKMYTEGIVGGSP